MQNKLKLDSIRQLAEFLTSSSPSKHGEPGAACTRWVPVIPASGAIESISAQQKDDQINCSC